MTATPGGASSLGRGWAIGSVSWMDSDYLFVATLHLRWARPKLLPVRPFERKVAVTQRRLGVVSWRVTWLIVVFVMLAGVGWRWYRAAAPPPPPSPPDETASVLFPRTRALIAQKTESLQSYNDPISVDELCEFLGQHVGRPILPATFAAVTKAVTEDLLPAILHEASEVSDNDRFISQQVMAAVLNQHFPREVLINADVVFFPADSQLRTVVAEAAQDHFRDTGWHWRWIGESLDRTVPADAEQLRELDSYAAEELSEFLSVFAVALFEIAARDMPADGSIETRQALATFERLTHGNEVKSVDDGPETDANVVLTTPAAPLGYSDEAKRRLLAALPNPMFREITSDVGLDYAHRPKPSLDIIRYQLILPMGIAGGGVSAADFDGDGWDDLYFAGDRGGRLFRNVDGVRLQDATTEAGIDVAGETRAGYFIDFDNDGDQDLFLTFVWESNRLFENKGGGEFVEITDRVGLTGGKTVTHEAAWFDMENDGLLDLYTASYGTWPEGASPSLGRMNTTGQPNRLYRHRIDGEDHRFEEVATQLGVDDRGWTHCIGVWDYDQDGYSDLFSLNDFGASLVYRNLAGDGFAETSRATRLDACYNAMNFTLMDVNHDGNLSIYVSQVMKLTHRQRYKQPTEETEVVFTPANLDNLRLIQANLLYSKQPDQTYADMHSSRFEPANLGWAWGANAFDYENDADLDLLVLNGVERETPSFKAATPEKDLEYLRTRAFLRLYSNQANVVYASSQGYFYDVSSLSPLSYQGNSRSAAFFDFDGDGDLDVALNDYDAPARMYENVQTADNNWIRIKLTGTISNRDAIGALAQIRFDDQTRYAQVVARAGFLAQEPRSLHFGLGHAERVDELVVRWPSGIEQVVQNLEVNQLHQIREPRRDDAVD